MSKLALWRFKHAPQHVTSRQHCYWTTHSVASAEHVCTGCSTLSVSTPSTSYHTSCHTSLPLNTHQLVSSVITSHIIFVSQFTTQMEPGQDFWPGDPTRPGRWALWNKSSTMAW